jgi:anti-anti-sigma factor
VGDFDSSVRDRVGPQVSVAERDGVAVLALIGEHDMATAGELEARINEYAWQDRDVVVSFSAAEFIDSAIVATLYRGRQNLVSRGRRFVLHDDCAPIVRQVLDISGLQEGIPSTSSLDQAVLLAQGRAEA